MPRLRVCSLLFGIVLLGCGWGAAHADTRYITLIHTNDLHSHLLGYSPMLDYSPYSLNDDATRGGWARIATLIKRERARRDHPVIAVSSGDFMMGTLFHLAVRDTGFELNLLAEMGMDVITLGNHDFDLRPDGLARIISAARSRAPLPHLVFSHAQFNPDDPRDDSLQALFDAGIVTPQHIADIDGLRVGFFGTMGDHAIGVAPFAEPVTFADTLETARSMTQQLRNEHGADLIVHLSHGGLTDNPRTSEDDIIAQQISDLDVLFSGHSRFPLHHPRHHNGTWVAHAGEHGAHVGVMTLAIKEQQVELVDYELVDIDDSIPADPDIQARIDHYIAEQLDSHTLATHQLRSYQTLATTDFDVTKTEAESTLGNLVTDALLWAANRHLPDQEQAVVAVAANGLIRNSLLAGKSGDIALIDAFSVAPMGIGADDTLGYPLVAFYLTAADLRNLAEVMTTLAPVVGNAVSLNFAGLQFETLPQRLWFDRIVALKIGNSTTGYHTIDHSKHNPDLYRIVTNLYNVTMVSFIKAKSRGVLEITPRTASGEPVKDLDSLRIDRDPHQPGIQELKEWEALVSFLKQLPDTNGDGVADMPERYRQVEGRVVTLSGNDLSDYWRNPYWTTPLILAVGITLLAVLAGIGRKLFRRMRRRQPLQDHG